MCFACFCEFGLLLLWMLRLSCYVYRSALGIGLLAGFWLSLVLIDLLVLLVWLDWLMVVGLNCLVLFGRFFVD